jgi:hypothetical protein
VWQSQYGGHSLCSRIEAPLISREVLPETYFLLVIMTADAPAHHFYSFKHYAYVEPCEFLISLAGSSISDTQYCRSNPLLKKKVLHHESMDFSLYFFKWGRFRASCRRGFVNSLVWEVVWATNIQSPIQIKKKIGQVNRHSTNLQGGPIVRM